MAIKICMIAKNAVAEIIIVNSNSEIHRFLLEMHTGTCTLIYSFKTKELLSHPKTKIQFSASGAYMYCHFHDGFNDERILQYKLHNMHSNLTDFFKHVYMNSLIVHPDRIIAKCYTLSSMANYEADCMHYTLDTFAVYSPNEAQLYVNIPRTNSILISIMDNASDEYDIGHVTVFGICIQLQGCLFEIQANSQCRSSVVRYF